MREGNHILGVTMCQSVQGQGSYPVRKVQYLLGESTKQGVITNEGSVYTVSTEDVKLGLTIDN